MAGEAVADRLTNTCEAEQREQLMFLQAIKEYQGRERRFGGLVTK